MKPHKYDPSTIKPHEVVGLPEGEFTALLYEVGNRVTGKYRFGYHSTEDMCSEAILIIIDEIYKGSFKPRGPKPLAQQFRNWLRVWMRNRVSNLRRNKSCRYTNPDSLLNQAKYNLMHCLHINSFELTQSEMFARLSTAEESIDNNQLISKILSGLSVEDRKLFLRRSAGEELSPEESTSLEKKCREILNLEEPESEEEEY